MKLINASGLPESIYRFLGQDLYDHENISDTAISATTLLRPTQEILLCKRHHFEIEVDAIDRLWSLFGSGCHAILEKLPEKPGEFMQKEERLYHDYKGYTITGKFDLIVDGVLHDYKVTKAWTLIYKSREEEWAKQLSIYRWLYAKTYKQELSSKAKIIAILRDWELRNLTGYMRGKSIVKAVENYPKAPIVEVVIDLMPLEDTAKMVYSKIKDIIKHNDTLDEYLPECTKEERWWSEKKQEFAKCDRYCNASKFCKQHNDYLKEKK